MPRVFPSWAGLALLGWKTETFSPHSADVGQLLVDENTGKESRLGALESVYDAKCYSCARFALLQGLGI